MTPTSSDKLLKEKILGALWHVVAASSEGDMDDNNDVLNLTADELFAWIKNVYVESTLEYDDGK